MKKIVIILVILIPLALFGKNLSVLKLGLEQGLSNNNVNGIAQDRLGFMWIGTRAGLNRFDGNIFKVFKHTSLINNSINSNELNPIFADKTDNIIWIATERDGVNAYNYGTNTFSYYRHQNNTNSISSNGVTGISDDTEGNLWFATYNAGVDHFDKKTGVFTHYNQKNIRGLGSNYNWCVTDDHMGHLYIGHVTSGMSVISLKQKIAVNYLHSSSEPNSCPDNRVNCIFIDSKKRIWVGTNNGLALFLPRKRKFIVFKRSKDNLSSISGNVIRCIEEVDGNSIWIGTSTGGVSILNYEDEMFINPEKVSFQHIPVSEGPQGLSNANIESIHQDSYGNVWVGTAGGGLNFFRNKPDFFNKISYTPGESNPGGLSNKLVSGICIDKAGKLWVGTEERGVDIFRNSQRVQNLNHQNSILSNNIGSVFCDSQGTIWLGTVDGTIYTGNASNLQFKVMPGFEFAGGRVRTFFEDSKKNIWICTDNGLGKYNLTEKRAKTYHIGENGLTDNVVRSITEDRAGNLWVGSLSGGMCIFSADFKRINYFPPDNELYGINHIYRDTKNRIWVGTRYALLQFTDAKSNTHRSYGLKDGFQDNYFHAITEGNNSNHIWVSTTNGVSMLDVSRGNVQNFNNMDGIPLGDYMNATVTRSPEGVIYFGSQNGVCWFDSHMANPDLQLPQVRFSNFAVADNNTAYSVNMVDFPVSENIKLNYNQNTFTVSFNIPDYSLNEKVEYSYQMLGLSDNWYNTLNNKELTFRNLQPGSYTLNIKARLRNTEWSENLSSLTIIIAPPFWLSAWAKMCYTIIILILAYYITRFYKRKLDLENTLFLEKKNHLQEQEMNDERMRFFTNITHELRTPLTLIIGPLEDLNNDDTMQPLQKKRISSIHRSAKRLLDLINQILEFRKSETRNRKLSVKKGDLAALISEVGTKYQELNQNNKISLLIKTPTDMPELYFDPEVLTIVIDNLLSNAMKYTLKGRIELTLEKVFEHNKLIAQIRVSDTGTGIPREALPRIFDRYYQVRDEHQASGSGIGLALVKNMIDLHEGEISVESTAEKGTEFTIRLRMDHTYPEAQHAERNDIEPEGPETILHTDGKQVLLVVEDNAEICDYIRDCFAESFDVMQAENGKAGLDIALNKIPDIIITDLMMPVMDGIELCRRLKEDVRTCHIPVVMLTAKDSIQDKTEGYNVGADSYLTKPFSGTLIRSRVANLLETRKKIASLFSSSIVSKQSIVQESISKLDSEFIDKLTQIIEENLEIEQLNIAQIAEQMNMSHSSLYRKIKTLTGMSANEFIRKIRMRNAEKLLLSCKYSIAEIIYKVGISTPAYFRQCFKDEFGVTPTEYMKNIKAGAN